MDPEGIEPVQLQQENDRLLEECLKDIHAELEKLIAKTYQANQITTTSGLRQLRTRITSLISGTGNLTPKKGGKLADFYNAEHEMADNCNVLYDRTKRGLEDIQNIDMLELEDLILKLEKSIERRKAPDNDILQQYRNAFIKRQIEQDVSARVSEINSDGPAGDTGEIIDLKPGPGKQLPEEKEPQTTAETKEQATEDTAIKKEGIDTKALSALYNYINILEQKYSLYQPEISDKGDYIAKADWKVEIGRKSIKGTIREGMFRTLLIINTRWHPSNDLRGLMEYIQHHAGNIPSNQYESLCLINTSWDVQIRDWVQNYNHQRLGLFLCDLEDGNLIYNRNYDKNRLFVFWHDTTPEKQSLNNRILEWFKTEEYLTSHDLTGSFDLNRPGAEKLIKELEKSGMLLDVGFDSPRYTLSNTRK